MPEWSAPAQYRLKQRAYISPLPGKPQRLMEAGSLVTTTTRPGPHMEPVDEEAKAAYARADPAKGALHPTLKLPVVGGISEAQALQFQQLGLLMPDTARAHAAEAEAQALREKLAEAQAELAAARTAAGQPASVAGPPAPKTPPPPPPPKAPKPA